MKYKLMLLVLCCGLLAVQVQSTTRKPVVAAKQGDSQSAAQQLPPEHVTYEFLFRHVANVEALAAQKDQAGKNSTAIRNKVRDDFALTDAQADSLKSTALDCLMQARQLDEQARQIIAQTRAFYAKGQANGQPAPKCPPALYTLQAQRNGVFLSGKLRLQQQFGDAAFGVFDSQVKQKYAKDIHKPVPHMNAHR